MTADLLIDTARKQLRYRDFTIEESINGWEWTHRSWPAVKATGNCQTVFDAVEAVDAWHEHSTSEVA